MHGLVLIQYIDLFGWVTSDVGGAATKQGLVQLVKFW